MATRLRQTLTVLAAVMALVLAGCSDASDYIGQPGDTEEHDMSLDEQFHELMQRPDIEQAVAHYDEMLTDIRPALREVADLPEWQRRDGRGSQPGCSRSFPDIGVWDAENRFMDRWHAKGPITDENWSAAVDAVHRIAGDYGFDTVTQDINHGGRKSHKITDNYGAELSLSTEGYTTIRVFTGCHLKPDAKNHGQPRPRPERTTGPATETG
ncbi:LppA family lipoprotein [Haloechinothrix sp. LS1_15]|uniref:LppA family lipoprotein n=1 Tax=Haloechinothrix sp. LS1_15 TaxID=2652248 RepID=UPI00294B98A8|nr:LppA family lipoprotein [Haloechinothrix sp. LS1_15]